MTYVMALDQGTTSSRAILFDRVGKIHAVAQREFPQIFPQPGWVEHDPMEIWSTQSGVADAVLADAGLDGADVTAVSITNQRETTVVWDRATGVPIHNAIVWQDRRTASVCEALRADGVEDLVRRKTGLLLDPYFSGTKIAWILDHVAGARSRAERGELAFGTIDTWIASRLTGGACHVTDVSNASRTLLFDIVARDWDDELLHLFRVPRGLLPDVRSSSEIFADISADLAVRGVPLAGIIGDQQGAAMGQMCIEAGMAKNTYGTGCFLLMNIGREMRESRNKLLTTVAWERDGKLDYALEGSVFIGGAIVQWLRDGLKIIRDSSEVEALARSVDDSGGVVLVPALAGLGAPHWDPYARGAIVGLTRGTTNAHIARAALEGMACSVCDLVTAMESDAGVAIPELRVDGGAAANDLLLQIQADLLGVPVVRPTILETTALGSAYMAGLAVGLWKSVDEIAAFREIDRIFEPMLKESDAARHKERWAEAVRRSMSWAEPDEKAGSA